MIQITTHHFKLSNFGNMNLICKYIKWIWRAGLSAVEGLFWAHQAGLSSGHPACLFVLCMCECARARTCLMYCVHYFSIYPSRDTTLVIFTSPPFQMYLFHDSHRIIICSIRKFIYMIYNCLQTVYVFGKKVLHICFLFFKVYVNYILGWKKRETIDLWPVKIFKKI